MVVNASLQGHAIAALKNDMAPLQPSCFVTTGMCHTQNASAFGLSRSFGVGHNDMHLLPQASYPNQQFQPCRAPLPQRAYHAQSPSYNFSFVKPTVHHTQQPFHPCSLPSLPNRGQRQYITDEQWRAHSSDFNPDYQHGVWVAGGRTPLCSGAPFVQEGVCMFFFFFFNLLL